VGSRARWRSGTRMLVSLLSTYCAYTCSLLDSAAAGGRWDVGQLFSFRSLVMSCPCLLSWPGYYFTVLVLFLLRRDPTRVILGRIWHGLLLVPVFHKRDPHFVASERLNTIPSWRLFLHIVRQDGSIYHPPHVAMTKVGGHHHAYGARHAGAQALAWHRRNEQVGHGAIQLHLKCCGVD
jgi:hypothetical protein